MAGKTNVQFPGEEERVALELRFEAVQIDEYSGAGDYDIPGDFERASRTPGRSELESVVAGVLVRPWWSGAPGAGNVRCEPGCVFW